MDVLEAAQSRRKDGVTWARERLLVRQLCREARRARQAGKDARSFDVCVERAVRRALAAVGRRVAQRDFLATSRHWRRRLQPVRRARADGRRYRCRNQTSVQNAQR